MIKEYKVKSLCQFFDEHGKYLNTKNYACTVPRSKFNIQCIVPPNAVMLNSKETSNDGVRTYAIQVQTPEGYKIITRTVLPIKERIPEPEQLRYSLDGIIDANFMEEASQI